MCYDSYTSLKSLTFGVLGSALLYNTIPELAIFNLYVFLMQFYDYIFWINPSKNDINFYFTKIAMISVLLQPIIWALCIIYIGKKEIYFIEKVLLVIYLFIAISFIIYHWNDINYTLVNEISYPGLYWEWTSHEKLGRNYWGFFYILTISLLTYNHVIYPYNIGFAILFIGFFIIAYDNYYRTSSAGRMWCKTMPFAYFISGIFIFIYSQIKNKKSIKIL